MSGADAGNWRALNRANWDERVAVHLKSPGYDLNPLRAGRGVLNPVDEAEIGEVEGLRVLHLQCHFGADTLYAFAQRGATVVGLDFSGAAIDAARTLAGELGLSDRARFVPADLYDAPAALAEPAAFNLVYTSWGVTCWLPDIRRWAEIVAHFLKPREPSAPTRIPRPMSSMTAPGLPTAGPAISRPTSSASRSSWPITRLRRSDGASCGSATAVQHDAA